MNEPEDLASRARRTRRNIMKMGAILAASLAGASIAGIEFGSCRRPSYSNRPSNTTYTGR